MQDDMGDKLLKMQHERIQKKIESLTEKSTPDAIHNIIKEIADIENEIHRAFLIKLIAKQTGLERKAIRKDLDNLLKDQQVQEETKTDISIAHPAYDCISNCLILGFREMVVKGGDPDDRNFYITSAADKITLVEGSKTWDCEGKTIVFHARDRVLLNVTDRWSKAKIQDFIDNKQRDITGLYYKVKNILKEYIELQKDAQYGLLAAWIIATYFHRLFHAFPFLFIYGKKQTGKTRLLDLLERLCFNAIKVKGVSVASLADTLDGIRGTFLNDQAEALSSPKMEEILGILADSYTVGGGKRRIVDISNRRRRILEFETYGPKAFASIKDIDTDIKDRCIQIIMIRSIADYPYPEPFLPIWGDLRDNLYRQLLIQWKTVKALYEISGDGVTHRVRELWRPIDTILKLEQVQEIEAEAIKKFFLESMLETQNELTEFEEELFDILRRLLSDENERILTVKEIAEHITDKGDMSRRGLETWIGRTINQFNLFTKHVKRSYTFNLQHIENIYSRYTQTSCFSREVAKPATDNDLHGTTAKTIGCRGCTEVATETTKIQPIQPVISEVVPSKPLSNNAKNNLSTKTTTSNRYENNEEILDLSGAEVIGCSTES
jgi:hypothetical protein